MGILEFIETGYINKITNERIRTKITEMENVEFIFKIEGDIMKSIDSRLELFGHSTNHMEILESRIDKLEDDIKMILDSLQDIDYERFDKNG